MKNKTETLAALVIELQNGNEEAFEKLYRETFKHAYAIAKIMLNNEEDIQDVLQNTYFSVSQNINSLKKPESFESWLGVIVKHESQKHLSKQKRITDIFISAKKSKEFDPPENINMPFDFLEKKEALNAIRGVINSLPEEKRACVYLHYFEQHSVAEIAEMLGVPTGTVVSRLHYARKKLEKELAKLQKKDNTLFGIGIVPIIVSVFAYSIESTVVPVAAQTAVFAGVAAVQTGNAVAASSAAAGTAGGTATATAATAAGSAGTGSAAGAATTAAVATKIAAVAVAGTVAAGGTVATVNYVQEKKEEAVTTVVYPEEYTTAPALYETETAVFEIAEGTTLTETSSAPILPPSTVAGTETQSVSATNHPTTKAQKTTAAPTTTAPSTSKPTTTAPSTTAPTTTKPVTTAKPTTTKKDTTRATRKPTTTIKATTTSASDVYGISSGVINEYTGNGGSVAIPSKIGSQTVTAVGSSAFEGNTDIPSVSLPSTVTKIGTLAFSECTNLKSVSLPSSLESIGIGAFYGCTSLSSVSIPDGTKSIQSEAFAFCDNLKTVTIPDSVTSISDDAFYGSDGVTVRCSEGSAAHEFCLANSVNFELI